MTQRIFKMQIAEEMNYMIRELEWANSRRTIRVKAGDITDDMVAQIQHAMSEDKKNKLSEQNRNTVEIYKELLYNDIIPKKEQE